MASQQMMGVLEKQFNAAMPQEAEACEITK